MHHSLTKKNAPHPPAIIHLYSDAEVLLNPTQAYEDYEKKRQIILGGCGTLRSKSTKCRKDEERASSASRFRPCLTQGKAVVSHT
ncbi:hypothetical protein E2C01_036941 [Portunus trituberculatus]|uniref:Uncharacterized protein n=1 Tax=Portunus trituberculatus TaxID=210409 RepID=A0A5B7FCL4_PORTR|nr:hypothetical protein [Portunus trituberculatus]